MVSNGSPVRVVFLGMRCSLSVPPLVALLDGGFDVRAVAVPKGGGEHEIDALARGRDVPVIEVTGPPGTEVVAAHRPQVLVVACFPWRVPRAVREAAPLGALNVHPSLLPVGRGPEPVFWTLRRGERRTGATVHLMDDGLDTGPVVGQEAFGLVDGVRAPTVERRCAEVGARLLVEAIPALVAGTATLRPQEGALATAAPVPGAGDFVVPTNLPARWAFNFVRGVAPLGGPLTLAIVGTGERYSIVDALAYEPERVLGRPVVWEGETALVRFKPGVVRMVLRMGG